MFFGWSWRNRKVTTCFVLVEKENPISRKGKGFAKCQVIKEDGDMCPTEISMGTKGSTDGMTNHLRLKHKITAKRDGPEDDCPFPTKKVHESVEEKICSLVAEDGIAFRTLVN